MRSIPLAIENSENLHLSHFISSILGSLQTMIEMLSLISLTMAAEVLTHFLAQFQASVNFFERDMKRVINTTSTCRTFKIASVVNLLGMVVQERAINLVAADPNGRVRREGYPTGLDMPALFLCMCHILF